MHTSGADLQVCEITALLLHELACHALYAAVHFLLLRQAASHCSFHGLQTSLCSLPQCLNYCSILTLAPVCSLKPANRVAELRVYLDSRCVCLMSNFGSTCTWEMLVQCQGYWPYYACKQINTLNQDCHNMTCHAVFIHCLQGVRDYRLFRFKVRVCQHRISTLHCSHIWLHQHMQPLLLHNYTHRLPDSTQNDLQRDPAQKDAPVAAACLSKRDVTSWAAPSSSVVREVA